MAQVTITLASPYYEVSFNLANIPVGQIPYSLVDGSIVAVDVWMKVNPPVPRQPSEDQVPSILDDYSPPEPPPSTPYVPNFVLTGNILGNDEMSIPDTNYIVTILDTRSREVISQAVYYIFGTTFDIDTATPLSVTSQADLNPVYFPGQ